MAAKRKQKVVKRIVGMRGVGKSTAQSEYAIQLLVGQKGSGKTTDIINTIKYYIKQQKRRKEDWKVWVFTSTPDEFKKLNPENRKTRINFRNQVFISSNVELLKNSWHIFKDGLVVLDNEFSVAIKNHCHCLFVPRTNRINILMSCGSLLDIDYKVVCNARYLKMFNLSDVPVTVGQRKKLADRFQNLPLLDIAQYVTNHVREGYYYINDYVKGKKPNYDRYTLVDLQNNKVICDERPFFFACKAISVSNIPQTIDGLIMASERLEKYSAYFEQKY
jgi:hypothetical protein